MAVMKIWETVKGASGVPVIRLDDRVNRQDIDFTATPGLSDPFDEDTTIITLRADADCAVKVGTNPVATVEDYPIEANVLHDFEVEPGQRLSVIEV